MSKVELDWRHNPFNFCAVPIILLVRVEGCSIMDSPPGRPPTFAGAPRTPVLPKLLATPESPEALEPPLPTNMHEVLLTPGLWSLLGNTKHPKEENSKSAPLAAQPLLSTKQSSDTLSHTYVDSTASQVVHLSQSSELSNAEMRKTMTMIYQFPNPDSFQCDAVSQGDSAAPSLNMSYNLATKFENNESDNEMREEEKSMEP